MLSGTQIRMARVALHWKIDDLAEKTGLPWARLQKVERSNAIPDVPGETMVRLRQIFEEAGVVFTDATDATEPGVTLRKAG